MTLLQRERLQSFRLHGYFVVPAFLNPIELGELRRACDIALDRARAESTENGHTTPKIGVLTESSYFSHQPDALDRLMKFVGSARVCSLLEGLALEGEDDTSAMPGATRIAMEAGDACVFHAWSIHRATYQRSPLRRTLDALYAFGGLPSPQWTVPKG